MEHQVLAGLPGGAPIQIDHLVPNENGGVSGFGVLAQAILANKFNVNQLRTNAVLRKDEWEALDTTLIDVARQRLNGVADLMSRGLTYPLSNALGITRLEWETISNMTPAEINMSGLAESEYDRVNFELTGIPIPIIHKDFWINARVLAASRNLGQPLDTTQVALAGRLVSERLEQLLFNGGFSAGAQGTIYGYTNHPNRNTGSVTASWTTATGAQIIADAIEMIGVAHADFMFGPYMIYMTGPAFVNCANDFKTESDRTILERLNVIPGIGEAKASDTLTSTNVLMIQMTQDVVDIIDGIQPTVVQWETKGGMQLNFKVMTIMVPRTKADQEGQSGIVHYS
jgi:hypothetical protein